MSGKHSSRIALGLASTLVSFAAVGANQAAATEVDSFTPRTSDLADATAEVNAKFRQDLAYCVQKTNLERPGDLDLLYKTCHETLGGWGWSKIETYFNQTKRVDSRWVHRRDSVYRYANFFDGYGMFFIQQASALRIGDYIIGADKLGHFTEEGYKYFEIAFKEGKGINAALNWGDESERAFLGLKGTGVYSFGDLNANFNGMLFYKQLAPNRWNASEARQTYVIKDGSGRWILNPAKPFDVGVITANGATDEGINCSFFASQKMSGEFAKGLAELNKKTGRSLTCPVSSHLCENLIRKFEYPQFLQKLVSPLCLDPSHRPIAYFIRNPEE